MGGNQSYIGTSNLPVKDADVLKLFYLRSLVSLPREGGYEVSTGNYCGT